MDFCGPYLLCSAGALPFCFPLITAQDQFCVTLLGQSALAALLVSDPERVVQGQLHGQKFFKICWMNSFIIIYELSESLETFLVQYCNQPFST